MAVAHASDTQLHTFKRAAVMTQGLNNVSVYGHNDGYAVKHAGKLHAVAPHDIDPLLHKVTQENMAAFQKAAMLGVNRLSDGSFTLRPHIKGNGGGPVTAAWFYSITKALCYGTAAAAVTTAAVAAPTLIAAGQGITIVAANAVSSTGCVATAAAWGATILIRHSFILRKSLLCFHSLP